MSNDKSTVIPFPKAKDASEVFIQGIRNAFANHPERERLEPVIAKLAGYGKLPPLNITFHPPGFEKLTADERAEIGRGIRELLVSYASKVATPLLTELALATIARAELERALSETA